MSQAATTPELPVAVAEAVASGRSRSRRPRFDSSGQSRCLSCDEVPASPKSPWCAEHRLEARRASSRIAHAARDSERRAARLGPQAGIKGVAPNLPNGGTYDVDQGMYLPAVSVVALKERIDALSQSATSAQAYLTESGQSLDREDPVHGRQTDRRHIEQLAGAAFVLLSQANYFLAPERSA